MECDTVKSLNGSLIAKVPGREFIRTFGGKELKVGGDIFAFNRHSEKIGIEPIGT